MIVEKTEFNGRTYRRYPQSERRTDRVYFQPSTTDRKAGVGYLHQEVWRDAHGPIPRGMHIHHIDFDPLNNELSNLVALTPTEHVRVHLETDPERVARSRDHMEAIRPLTKAWHASEEGRAWHVEHGKRTAATRMPTEAVCDHCGSLYSSKSPGRFCSNACKTKFRLASGVDDETRECAQCGASFTANRYSKVTTCGHACAARRRWVDRKARA